jgi:hypothetical protein
MDWLVEELRKLNCPMPSAHGSKRQLLRCKLTSSIVRRGGIWRYNITTHSTEARVSLPFIRKIEGLIH